MWHGFVDSVSEQCVYVVAPVFHPVLVCQVQNGGGGVSGAEWGERERQECSNQEETPTSGM